MKTKATRKVVQGVRSEAGDAPSTSGIQIRRTVTIEKPREEVYAFWRRMENFPLFMRHVKSVDQVTPERSHWKIVIAGGRTLEWDAILVQDLPSELLSWRSLDDADVQNAGSVAFRRAPGNRGTQVTVTITYNPPAGQLGHLFAQMSRQDPLEWVSQDLLRFKALLETGEVPTAQMRLEETPEESLLRRAS
jgi:uncharacterized membrane protein